jgi:hypothetical protein
LHLLSHGRHGGHRREGSRHLHTPPPEDTAGPS